MSLRSVADAQRIMKDNDVSASKLLADFKNWSPEAKTFLESHSAPVSPTVPAETIASEAALITDKIPTFADKFSFLAEMGVPLTPVRPGTKRAFLDDFPTTATTDLDQIGVWDVQYPDHNAACVARAEVGGVWFFEIDSPDVVERIKHDTGHKLFDEVQTFRVRSRPGRGHMYFRHNAASMALGNIAQTYVIGQDWSVRTNREYVVAPGSIHPDTKKPYTVLSNVPIIEAPQWLIDWLLSQKIQKQTASADAAPRNERGKIPHGAIHNWMLSQAGRLRRAGLEQDEIEPILLRLVHENCEPPIDDNKVRTMAASVCKSWAPGDVQESGQLTFNQTPGSPAPIAAQTMTFKFPAVQGSHRDYVVNPAMGQKDGWFPLGSPSLVGGSTGSNKSTWVQDILFAQKRGANVWGHTTNGLPYLVVMFDRGSKSHLRTMERLGYDVGEIPTAFLPPVTDDDALKAILAAIESADPLPKIVFIEGADMLVEDANKGQFVVPFMSGLQRIAEHYHIAMILSVGAPKNKAGEGYTAKRDSILGSEKWSRMSETVVAMQFVEGDDTDSRRACFVLLRNGPPERFNLALLGGKLVVDTAPRPEKPTQMNQAELAQKWYLDLFSDGKGGQKESVTLEEHRKGMQRTMIPEYALVRARKTLGIYFNNATKLYTFITGSLTRNTVKLDAPETAQTSTPETSETADVSQGF